MLAEEISSKAGPFTVIGGQSETDFRYDSENRILYLLTSTPLEITSDQSSVTDAMIAVEEDVSAKLTIKDLNIDLKYCNGSALSIPRGASLDLTVEGENLIRSYAAGPSILVNNGARLTVNGADTETLEVYGAQMYSYSDQGGISGGLATGFAGIGGPNSSGAYTYTGEIIINGGKIDSHGFGYGAGIGGGDYGSGGTITVNGGIVTATTGEGLPSGWNDSTTAKASGIGASQGQNGGVITITGGTVTAYGGYGCAGIGGGTADVTISGGEVTACGGPSAAGIGGYNQNKGEIKINIGAGAKVTAYGGTGACGIGQGSNTSAPVTLKIEDGAEVYAFSREGSNRPAITAVSNSADQPANLVNAYITNMTLPSDVPIAAYLNDKTKKLTVPKGTAGVAFTTDTAGEFVARTAPEAEASLGRTYQFILEDYSKATVTSGTSLTMEKVKAVEAAELAKEPTPNAQADYENNRLTGLVPNAEYRLEVSGFYLEAAADGNGNITDSRFPQFYGAQISIVKLGNGTNLLNSDPQYLQTFQPVVSDIKVKTVPAKVDYTVGDTADWSGLEVTLAYTAGSQQYSRDVALSDFEANGVSIAPANGAVLNTIGNMDVTVSCGENVTAFSVGVRDTHKVAQIGDAKYETLAEAFEAAQQMTEWNGTAVSRENPVEIQLLDNVVLNDTILIEDRYGRPQTYHVKLSGAGFTVSRGADFKDDMVHVAQSSTLILENVIFDGALTDGTAGSSVLYMGSNRKSGMPKHHDTHDNHVVLGEGAVLKNNHSAQSGGAVDLEAGTLVLDGGAIQDNISEKMGGGVYVGIGQKGTNDYADQFYPAVFIMNDGTISGNKATNNYCYGGGVYVESISKAEYEQRTNSSGFIMNGGVIENNAAYDGGAINMSNYDNVQILGGTIQNNRCENAQGAARTTGTTGIICSFGASLRIGGKVNITDQIGISFYRTSSSEKHGKIIVEDVLDVNGNSLQLRVNSSDENCPDGTVLVEKGEKFSGSINLSDFVWKYNRNGGENTNRTLIASDDGTQLLAATLKNAAQRGTTDLSYEYGVKLGDLDLSVCELYDEATGKTLSGSWRIVYGEDENDGTVKTINEGKDPYEIKAVFTPDDTLFSEKEVTFHLTITRIKPDYTVPSGLTAIYGQTLADVTLPAGFTWQDAVTTGVGAAGSNTFQVTFTPEDPELYSAVADIEVTVTVNPAVPVLAAGEGPTASRVRSGQMLSDSKITGVVSGIDGEPLEGTWTWKNDREMTEIGTFEEAVVFTPTDANYASLEMTVSVTVSRTTSGGSGGSAAATSYTVTFDTQGGSSVSSKTVSRNTAAAEPAAPTKEGYTFEGWFTDRECTTAYDFSTKVTKNITLYAKWVEDAEKPTEWENPFTDVSEKDWYYDDVEYVGKNGLFSGMTDTEFAPNGLITRGMMVTVLYRAEGEPEVTGTATFADVSDTAYYAKAVVWGQQNGIIMGYSDTAFAPDQNITREQIAAIMHRYAQYREYDVSAGENTNILSYTDYDSISKYAVPSVQYAVGSGLMQGKTDTTINPRDNATRAETAAILHRFIEENK